MRSSAASSSDWFGEMSIIDVQPTGLASDFHVSSNDLGGLLMVGMYGTQPLEGSGTVLAVTIEIRKNVNKGLPFRVSGQINEGLIPLIIAGEVGGVRLVPGRLPDPTR